MRDHVYRIVGVRGGRTKRSELVYVRGSVKTGFELVPEQLITERNSRSRLGGYEFDGSSKANREHGKKDQLERDDASAPGKEKRRRRDE